MLFIICGVDGDVLKCRECVVITSTTYNKGLNIAVVQIYT